MTSLALAYITGTSLLQVNPIIRLPLCRKSGLKEDCHECPPQLRNKCKSTRSLCICKYPGHKHGCPNYHLKEGCPPSSPMFGDAFDIDEQVFAICVSFDLEEYVKKRKSLHPDWTYPQLANCLHWQGTVRRLLKEECKKFLNTHPGYECTLVPEAMGVDVTQTLEEHGEVILEWPVKKIVTKVAMLARKR